MIQIHLDPVGGIAGDMFVAAMLDAMPHLRERTFADVRAVLPQDVALPSLVEGESAGLRSSRLVPPDPNAGGDTGGHDKSFLGLSRRISDASLGSGTAEHAQAILRILAEAEARIHSAAVDDIHFHEIGGWDSLIDIVAAGSIVAALADAGWSVSELPRGGGTIQSEHGRLPVPAPAVVEILRGYRWRDDGVEGERVTPTGAAIIRHLVKPGHAAAPVFGRLAASGYGAGSRSLAGVPNVLRVMVFDQAEDVTPLSVVVVSFDVDDMTGEETGVAADKLRATGGVIDLSIATRSGKKGRPLTDFRLLVAPGHLDAVTSACFDQTSTIGLRWRLENRMVLPREAVLVGEDAHRVKSVTRPGGHRTVKSESDDLARFDTLAARRAAGTKAEGDSQ